MGSCKNEIKRYLATYIIDFIWDGNPKGDLSA